MVHHIHDASLPEQKDEDAENEEIVVSIEEAARNAAHQTAEVLQRIYGIVDANRWRLRDDIDVWDEEAMRREMPRWRWRAVGHPLVGTIIEVSYSIAKIVILICVVVLAVLTVSALYTDWLAHLLRDVYAGVWIPALLVPALAYVYFDVDDYLKSWHTGVSWSLGDKYFPWVDNRPAFREVRELLRYNIHETYASIVDGKNRKVIGCIKAHVINGGTIDFCLERRETES